MTFYAISTKKNNYDQAHCDIHIAYGLADGLQALGIDSVVLWGGDDCHLRGVRHQNYKRAELQKNDVLLYYSDTLGLELYTDECANLRGSAERWWFPSYVEGYKGKFFNRIFIDNQDYVNRVRRYTYDAIVDWLMFGCPYNVSYNLKNPYPDGRHLFYSGRLMEHGENSQLLQFPQLLKHLPEDYHIWFCSACVWIPEDFPDPRVAGKVACSPLNSAIKPFKTDEKWNYVFLERNYFIECVNRVVQYHPRIHFLGPLAYGTFFNFILYSHCVIDFGYTYNCVGPNCKIMEPMRYGVPVVADGISFSFPLINEYRLGAVAPYRDIKTMAKLINFIDPGTLEIRFAKGVKFRNDHSWRARARQLLKLTGC